MQCSRCNQPMVDPDDGTRINSRGPYSGRLCLDCKETTAHTPIEELDCWQYMNKRGLQFRLRDAVQFSRTRY